MSQVHPKLPTAFERDCWNSRVTANIHVLLCVVASLCAIYNVPTPFLSVETLVLARTWELEYTMLHTAGYLAWDLCDKFRMMRHPGGTFDGGPLIFVHHAMGVVGYYLCIGYGRGATLFVLFIMTELTTPLVANLYFYEKAGDQRKRVLSGVALLVAFVPVRLCLSVFCVWVLWHHYDAGFADMAPPYLAFMVGALGTATTLNYYWWSRILLGSLRAVGLLQKQKARTQRAP
eukprot:CAMPEP_0115871288 /NCGR_PEP_ID=MMETSP0287-20121206/22785_1 /TAXON_ID=412157 /ORGANISM="Chrysochromulina rotalis, Strain UIO044" /LENGTH=231 /DNA_ID=CAMNT_0003326077 /DNA_START=40 /DNA_END=735 /DNA_ORIENTATION=+